MTQPVLLDLFCCEGVGARGYLEAGFRVIGADTDATRARRYPGEGFFVGDWRDALDYYAGRVDAVHASPPCQGYSRATAGNPVARARYPRLIGEVREALEASGLPYVIENVEQARSDMRDPVRLCGTMFALATTDDDGTPLELRRHRLFESSVVIPQPPCAHGRHAAQVAGSYGGARRDKDEARLVRKGGYVPSKAVQEKLLRVPAGAHTLHGLWQSIPPAYTAFVGACLREAVA